MCLELKTALKNVHKYVQEAFLTIAKIFSNTFEYAVFNSKHITSSKHFSKIPPKSLNRPFHFLYPSFKILVCNPPHNRAASVAGQIHGYLPTRSAPLILT